MQQIKCLQLYVICVDEPIWVIAYNISNGFTRIFSSDALMLLNTAIYYTYTGGQTASRKNPSASASNIIANIRNSAGDAIGTGLLPVGLNWLLSTFGWNCFWWFEIIYLVFLLCKNTKQCNKINLLYHIFSETKKTKITSTLFFIPPHNVYTIILPFKVHDPWVIQLHGIPTVIYSVA